MVGSLFHHGLPAPTPARPMGQVRMSSNYTPSPFNPYANKSPIVKTKMISPSTPKPAAARRPSLTRTQSCPSTTRTQLCPSTTSAPMFPDQILENLYISDLETARAVLSPNYSGPGRPKIKYVLTLLDNPKEQPQALMPTLPDSDVKPDFVLKLIKISDYNEVNLLQKLPEACAFIKTSLANNDGGVLVHCRKGISRSGSVIVAYLMQELGLGFDDALQQAKKCRNKIWPNRSFGEQLKMWKEMDYNLNDEAGLEKPLYADWKAKTRFRPEAFDIA